MKVRGYRVEFGAIQRALETHPAVETAAVLALPDQQGEKRLVAYVVIDSTAQAEQAVDSSTDSHTDEHVALWRSLSEEALSTRVHDG